MNLDFYGDPHCQKTKRYEVFNYSLNETRHTFLHNGVVKKVGIIGGGPSALFMLSRLREFAPGNFSVEIFEKGNTLGNGMPYCKEGANDEHVTNVSANEIPIVNQAFSQWIKTVDTDTLKKYDIDPENINEYKVIPRLLFGKYLKQQFMDELDASKRNGIKIEVHIGHEVVDIIPKDNGRYDVLTTKQQYKDFDYVIICIGHSWPKIYEGTYPKYFDSPYPPEKLSFQANYTVAVRGASLTAVDAIRTLARANGTFEYEGDKLRYLKNSDSPDFKIALHTKNGTLPALRFHLEDPRLSPKHLLSDEEIAAHINNNKGYLSLDYIFDKDYKKVLLGKDREKYGFIENMSLEEFMEHIWRERNSYEPFKLFKKEFIEAEESIGKKESIYWKELLAIFSFAANYPSKYFSAEDMLRMKNVLMPLISTVIAFAPQESAKEILALHEADAISMVAVGDNSSIAPNEKGGIAYTFIENGKDKTIHYNAFVDCIGQKHFDIKGFPFKTLVEKGELRQAKLSFGDREKGIAELNANNPDVAYDELNDVYTLDVVGIEVNDAFQVIKANSQPNEGLYLMSVPYMGGYNPDYSGLDFCEEASKRIARAIKNQLGKA